MLAGGPRKEECSPGEHLAQRLFNVLFCLPHLLDDEWAQVIPLVLAHLGNAMPLLERLLAANAEDEGRQRPLFWAATALAEGAKAAEVVRRQVVDGLEHLARTARDSIEWWVWNYSYALVLLGRLWQEPYAAQRLLVLACDDTVDLLTSVDAVRALGCLGLVNHLLALIQDGRLPQSVRVEAVWSLGELGRTNELLALVRNSKVDVEIRVEVTRAIGRLEGRVDELLALAQNGGLESEVRVEAAAELGELGHADKAAPILLAFARDDTVRPRTRFEAALALFEIALALGAVRIDAWTARRCSAALPEILAGLRALAEDPAAPEEVRPIAQLALRALENQHE